MHKKSETFSNLCEFKALVGKQSGKQVKALRSDNGDEYISGEFKDFCSKEGIRRELIVPHNPKHNGVMGIARAMLERELYLHAVKELLVLKDEPPNVVHP